MTRLFVLVVLSLLSAENAAAAADGAVVSARAQAARACGAVPESCAEAEAVLDGYLELLKKANACVRKPCSVETVSTIYDRDWELDKREHALPAAARAHAGDRPFLRLSLLVLGRGAAAMAAADPAARTKRKWRADPEMSRTLGALCGRDAEYCSLANSVLSRARGVRAAAQRCEADPCGLAELDRQAADMEHAVGDYYFKLEDRVAFDGEPIFAILSETRTHLSEMIARAAELKLGELEQGEAAASARMDALEKTPAGSDVSAAMAALEADRSALLEVYGDAAVGADRAISLVEADFTADPQRERLNAAVARLASLRARMSALRIARGLGGGAADESGGVAIPEAGARPAVYTGAYRPAGRTVAMDRRKVPLAPSGALSAPDILPDAPASLLERAKNIAGSDTMKRADALRRSGLTRTLGDPGGRAAFVHAQAGPMACAIVVQQQILLALGLLPKDDPVAQENALAEEAARRGFFDEGTPDAYNGELLIERGLLVSKQSGVGLEVLDAAVRRGGMVIANVDARPLWDQRSNAPVGHTVLVTGAEIERFGEGKTLGYYINDSAPPVGAGRFVPVETFRAAWNGLYRTFAEVR
ncbi:MAG: hypothetical protein HYV14_06240 [Elusimicrobia bacterium]|nr:hypothetical protein [Elusimicrobiota bacterium]